MTAAYLDASALVKLFKPEPETAPLVDALGSWSVYVSSELIVVEALCTARRLGPDAVERAALAVKGLDLVPFSEAIRSRAASRFESPLRALDAIHLASALSLGADIEAFLAYDTALCEAGRSQGLNVISPA